MNNNTCFGTLINSPCLHIFTTWPVWQCVTLYKTGVLCLCSARSHSLPGNSVRIRSDFLLVETQTRLSNNVHSSRQTHMEMYVLNTKYVYVYVRLCVYDIIHYNLLILQLYKNVDKCEKIQKIRYIKFWL